MDPEFEPTLVKNVRKELGVALYASNVLGSRGPRKMRVAVPEVKKDGKIMTWQPRQSLLALTLLCFLRPSSLIGRSLSLSHPAHAVRPEKDGMLPKLKAKNYENMMIMINKPPRWNEQVGAYVLNFNGRVTMASVKNFQLITPENRECFLRSYLPLNSSPILDSKCDLIDCTFKRIA